MIADGEAFSELLQSAYRNWWGHTEEEQRRAIACARGAFETYTPGRGNSLLGCLHEEYTRSVLCLLSFNTEIALLRESKRLISRPWSAREVRRCSYYDPVCREERGVSLVLSLAYPADLHKGLREFLGPLTRGPLRETAHHHLTLLSLALALPEERARRLAFDFRDRWREALRQDQDLRRLAKAVTDHCTLRADELRLQRDAVVLFGSNRFGFLDDVLQLRLKSLRDLYPQYEVHKNSQQPIWHHTVFARFTKPPAQAEPDTLKLMGRWRVPGERRVPIKAEIAVLIYPDPKALMEPEVVSLG